MNYPVTGTMQGTNIDGRTTRRRALVDDAALSHEESGVIKREFQVVGQSESFFFEILLIVRKDQVMRLFFGDGSNSLGSILIKSPNHARLMMLES